MTTARTVIKTFWDFVIERESVRLRRLVGLPRNQWTEDWIMRTYSFTNVKREHDRTTMLLQREFYDRNPQDHPSTIALLNATIFRFHGTIAAAREIGWSDAWDAARCARMLARTTFMMGHGQRVFTSAYIIPQAGSSDPKNIVVSRIIDYVWEFAAWITEVQTWAEMCARMKTIVGVGSFMAKEVMLDYMLITGWTPTDWETWTPVGPGARRGAGLVKHDALCSLPETEALQVCRDLYAERSQRWPTSIVVRDPSPTMTSAHFKMLTLDLDLTDVQFQLCEWAKYARVARGVGTPKRLFKPSEDDVTIRPLTDEQARDQRVYDYSGGEQ